MIRSEFHGKRGANAGDEFHELWALRRAIETISPTSTVQKVTVEGVRAEDEEGSEGPEWDGVDCAIYHGRSADEIDRIEIAQLKYSSANPTAEWTIARLTHSDKKKRNNSVIARLAEAYGAMAKRHQNLADNGGIAVKLVSNQSLNELTDAGKEAITTASGLAGQEAVEFLKALDFSECGTIGRAGLEERFILDIAAWDDSDALQHYAAFRQFIRDRMKPEGHRSVITAESILSIFGSADTRSIFPCPSQIDRIGAWVPRAASDEILAAWLSGNQRVCLHGQGGEGKTTVLQDIADKLPSNSVVVTFDCYGAGSYLNSDSYRHRPQDAFLQLANETGSSLLLPLILTKNRDADHPRLFMRKVEQAGKSLAAVDDQALLIITVDAMDNAVAAARDAADQTPCFVPAFLKLGNPPPNVRFLVSARTGRIDELNLPKSYTRVSLGPFTESETKQYLEGHLAPQTDEWLQQVHTLSDGNPRVLRYAVEASENQADQALAFLSPNGKNLGGIFSEILNTAFKKVGAENDVRRLCAAISLLPRPIPIASVASVSGFAEAHVSDILSDLRPGIIVDGDRVSFRDEDFEAFVQVEATELMTAVLSDAATHFAATAQSKSYEAEHAANILLRAERYAEVLALANQDITTYPIEDPAVRTVVHETRMRAALGICRKTQDTAAALKLLLAGADAFRKDAAIRQLLFDNLDLSAHFSRDQMRQLFLTDPEKRSRHGSFLMHATAASALEGDMASAAAQRRLLSAWFESRNDRIHADSADQYDRDDWKLEEFDLATYAFGRLQVAGVAAAAEFIRGARPSHFRRRISDQLIERLARSSEYDALAEYLVQLPRRYPGKGLAQALLALAGRPFDLDLLLSEIENCLPKLPKIFEATKQVYEESASPNDRVELIITAVEIAVLHRAPNRRLTRILKALSSDEFRSARDITGYAHFSSNVALRAFALLQVMKGRDPVASEFVPKLPIKGKSRAAQQKRRDRDEQIERAVKAVARIIPTLTVRAKALLGQSDPKDLVADLNKAAKSLNDTWHPSNERFETRARDLYVARSLVVLAAIDGVDAPSLLEAAVGLFKEYEFPERSGASELLRYAQLLPAISHLVPERVRAICSGWRNQKLPGQEKIDLITRYTRIALFQDRGIASEAFNYAVEIASEIDAESTHALAVCDQIAQRASVAMDAVQRRHSAEKLAAISKDIAERVGSVDNFPWKEIGRCLTRLDIPHALATCARFDQIGLVEADTLLDPILQEGLRVRQLDLAAVFALTALLNEPSTKLINGLIECGSLDRSEEAEYLAWEVMCRKNGMISDVAECLKKGGISPVGAWSEKLVATAEFIVKLPKSEIPEPDYGVGRRSKQLPVFDWAKAISADALVAEIKHIKGAAPKEDYVSMDSVLAHALESVPQHRRVEVLRYVASHSSELDLGYQLGGFLKNWLTKWSADDTVSRWCREELIHVLKDNLTEIARYIDMGQSQLPALLRMTQADDVTIVDALLAGIEGQVGELYSSLVYHLAAEISRYSPPDACAVALQDHLARRLQRLPTSERALSNMSDVPERADEAIARFVFASLGSPIAPTRWRAAHAIRRLAKMGETKTLRSLIEYYARIDEISFGHPVAPFYFLNARLWLMIGLARSAWESPGAIAAYKQWLFAIGEATEFPHVLLRAFAQSALLGLHSEDSVAMTSDELERISAINQPAKPRKNAPKGKSHSTFEKYGFDHTKDRAFDFDTMDTLPYVYNRAVSSFANPSGAAFLDRAEEWVVKEWKAPQKAYEVDGLRKETGIWRRRGLSSSTSHGSRPSVERYRSYLEFHAMHCAVGDFLVTEPLLKDADKWDSFESWLGRQGLTVAPIWLSDLREPKPLEAQFWNKPAGDKTWLRKRQPEDIKLELMLDDADWLVLASNHWSGDSELKSTVRVESCLVSPGTASALRRALEASDSSFAYRLAIGSDNEIDHGPFKLRSILSDLNTERELDEHDRFRGELGRPSIVPRKWVIEQLELSPCKAGFPTWLDSSGKPAIICKSWSDDATHDDEQPSYDYRVNGSRMTIRRDLMANLIEQTGMDLAVELTMRREMGERYARRGSGKEEETEFDRIIIFRKDGSIEATGQRLGNWRAHRAGARRFRKR